MLRLQLPSCLEFLLEAHRYKVAFGGRGGAKSWAFARALLYKAYNNPVRILCAREFQSSIRDSVHRLLADQITALDEENFFSVEQACIRGANGSEFSFEGLRHNVDKIKSYEGVDICWVEEAKNVSKSSWEVLIPTIRKDNSEIWVTFNPELETDYTYRLFVKDPPPNAVVQKINWRENPWFPKVLAEEMHTMEQRDYDSYLNIWEGNCRTTLDGAVYAQELRKVQSDGRFTRVPYDESLTVHTFWDLGWSDCTSIWFVQKAGFEYRLIDFYQARLQKFSHYLKILQDRSYVYGRHYLPHDADAESLAAKSIAKTMRDAGMQVTVVPRVQDKRNGLKACREIFDLCWFDESKCDDGIQALRHYRYEVDENGQFSREPKHDESSHAADAFETFARSISRKHEVPDKSLPEIEVFHTETQSALWMA